MTNEERSTILARAVARLTDVHDSTYSYVGDLLAEARELVRVVSDTRTGKTDDDLDEMLQRVAHAVGDMKARALMDKVGGVLDAKAFSALEAHYTLVEELRERDTQFRDLLNLS